MTENVWTEDMEKLTLAALNHFCKLHAQDEDYQQQARTAAWVAIQQFNPDRGKLSSLIFAAVKNELHKQHYLARMPKRVKLGPEFSMDQPSTDGNCLIRDELSNEQSQFTWLDWSGFLRRLTPGQRDAVLLRLAGYNDREIAAKLGISFQAVSLRVRKARPIFDRYI